MTLNLRYRDRTEGLIGLLTAANTDLDSVSQVSIYDGEVTDLKGWSLLKTPAVVVHYGTLNNRASSGLGGANNDRALAGPASASQRWFLQLVSSSPQGNRRLQQHVLQTLDDALVAGNRLKVFLTLQGTSAGDFSKVDPTAHRFGSVMTIICDAEESTQ